MGLLESLPSILLRCSVHVAPAPESRFPARANGKNAPASALAKSRIKRVERCHQRAEICPVPAATDLPGRLHKLLNTLGNSLGNGVTVAQQTLTLFVLVRIQVPQPHSEKAKQV